APVHLPSLRDDPRACLSVDLPSRAIWMRYTARCPGSGIPDVVGLRGAENRLVDDPIGWVPEGVPGSRGVVQGREVVGEKAAVGVDDARFDAVGREPGRFEPVEHLTRALAPDRLVAVTDEDQEARARVERREVDPLLALGDRARKDRDHGSGMRRLA